MRPSRDVELAFERLQLRLRPAPHSKLRRPRLGLQRRLIAVPPVNDLILKGHDREALVEAVCFMDSTSAAKFLLVHLGE